MRTSLLISSSACIGALAALLAALPLYLHYPIIPYLRFEAAEIPVILGFLLLGPKTGILSSVVYWIVLLLVGELSPLGPTMKFIAVAMTLLGLWLGFRIKREPRFSLFLGSCLGCLFRVASMSLFNCIVTVFMFPGLLKIAVGSISATLGMKFSSDIAAFAAVLGFTAVFNIIHTIISIVPAYLLVKSIVSFGKGAVETRRIWYVEFLRAASKRSPQRS